MTEATTTRATVNVSQTDLSAIDRPPSVDPEDSTVVLIPRGQWNALSLAMGADLEVLAFPDSHMARQGDSIVVTFPSDPQGNGVIVGTQLDARLDTDFADSAQLNDVERERRLYVRALAWTLATRANIVRANVAAYDLAHQRTGGAIQFAPILAALTTVVVIGLVAAAVVAVVAGPDFLRIKAEEHTREVAIQAAAQSARGRFEVYKATGVLPPPTPTEQAARVVIEQAAQNLQTESTRGGFVAQALNTVRGTVTDTASSLAPWGVAAVVILVLTSSSNRS